VPFSLTLKETDNKKNLAVAKRKHTSLVRVCNVKVNSVKYQAGVLKETLHLPDPIMANTY
jgi:hypothetical protein